jgi:pilus assembly protein CpaB
MIKGMALKGGNRFSLILGIGLGIVAAVLIAVYLTGAKSDGGGGTVSGPSAPVVVSTVDIPTGTKVDASMVTVKDFPEGGVLPGAFDNTEAVVGKITTIRVVAGEQMIADKMTETGGDLEAFGDNPPLNRVVTEGLRGTAVEVNSIVGAGGNLRPGDYVDVILTVKIPAQAGEGSDQISSTVVQNLQVLAIDTSVTGGSGGSAESAEDQKDSDEKATTVTLLATPVQSEVLALADACRVNYEGRLALSLRSFGDDGRFDQRSEWPADGHPPLCSSLFGLQFLP